VKRKLVGRGLSEVPLGQQKAEEKRRDEGGGEDGFKDSLIDIEKTEGWSSRKKRTIPSARDREPKSIHNEIQRKGGKIVKELLL